MNLDFFFAESQWIYLNPEAWEKEYKLWVKLQKSQDPRGIGRIEKNLQLLKLWIFQALFLLFDSQ